MMVGAWSKRRMTAAELNNVHEAVLQGAPRVQTLAQFDAAVADYVEAWREKNTMAPRIWFRGHADAKWHLVPPALRVNNPVDPQYDMHFFNEFKRRAVGLVTPQPATDWAWLYVAQHHGFPTRLLDWSEASHVALFFAVGHGPLEELRKKDACVWLLNAAEVNVRKWNFNYVVAMRDNVGESDKLLFPYKKGKPILPTAPTLVSVIPEYVSPRIRAQRGSFVAFADDPAALISLAHDDIMSKAPICKPIIIEADALNHVEGELIDAGAGHSALFPDISGLCDELARRRFMFKF